MPLSALDRILIQRTEETMQVFEFKREKEVKRMVRCVVPGCEAKTRGGPCKRHWRYRKEER